MLARKGFKSDEKSDFIRILMVGYYLEHALSLPNRFGKVTPILDQISHLKVGCSQGHRRREVAGDPRTFQNRG